MHQGDARYRISARAFSAWLFDMDGVITDTAAIHAAAWQQMFNDYLIRRESQTGIACEPFAVDPDYYIHVDGRLRYEGVESFLGSRRISLPWGDPADPPDRETVCGLGNRKNALFNDLLSTQGAVVYPSTVALIRHLRRLSKATGIVTSSENCSALLDAGGLSDLFQAQVDGEVAAAAKLPGKPAPDMYLEAARRLGSSPARTVVVEDAISGVRAGKAGHFGLVIGVARKDEAAQLRANGADVVCPDLGAIVLDA